MREHTHNDEGTHLLSEMVVESGHDESDDALQEDAQGKSVFRT